MNKLLDLIKEIYRKKGIQRILMNWQIFEHCKDLKGVMIDLGAGRNPSYYRYWRINPSQFIKVDIDKKTKPDVVADLNKTLPFDNNFADAAFLFNTLYIIKKPEELIKEIFRILKNNGKFFIYSPFIFNESKEPNDYFRYTSQGIEHLLKVGGFKDYQIVSVGERFTSAFNLIEKIIIFDILKIPLILLALFLDKIYPKKLKKLHPCPMGYFVKTKK
ncbi:MAG: methyltransferase domain-containing protein [Candidatus Nealsonbacteria bacterium]